ncbi:MAG: GNAT family N-acetyltransferase [Acidimicrobiales bacterium]
MANPTVRRATPADVDGIWEVFRTCFGASPAERDPWVAQLDADRAMVIDGPHGEVAAMTHVRPFEQWFGGRPVRLGGYSPVGVLPHHRGRGWGRAVCEAQLPDLRDRGEVIAGLFPASLAFYRSLGFECAGSYVHRRFPVGDLASIRPTRPVPVRRGTPGDVAAVHRCHAAAAPGRDGAVSRDERWWSHLLAPDLAGTELYVVDDPSARGELAGYAAYRHRRARPPYDYAVSVIEVLAEDPDVLRALWRVVASSGTQAPEIDLVGPAEDDLFLLADGASPEVVRSEIRWMLRLVDLPGAVAARGWPATARGRIGLQVHDRQAPWNDGRWTLEVEEGRARAVPGGDGAVEVTIGGLSSWWAGYATPARLARTGSLRCGDPSVLRTLGELLPATPPVLPDFY